MTQKITPAITKGFVIGLIMIAIALGMYLAGMETETSFRWIVYLIYVIGIIISINQYGKQIEYNATFGNYFAHGFKISAVVTILMILYIAIFIMVFPEFKTQAMDAARKAIREKNNMTDGQVEKAMDITRRFFMVFVIGGILFVYLVCGVIGSLIGAAVTKKQPRLFQEDHLTKIEP